VVGVPGPEHAHDHVDDTVDRASARGDGRHDDAGQDGAFDQVEDLVDVESGFHVGGSIAIGQRAKTSSTQSQHVSLTSCGARGPQWYCAPSTAVNST
jgi:hypothetical protein